MGLLTISGRIVHACMLVRTHACMRARTCACLLVCIYYVAVLEMEKDIPSGTDQFVIPCMVVCLLHTAR